MLTAQKMAFDVGLSPVYPDYVDRLIWAPVKVVS